MALNSEPNGADRNDDADLTKAFQELARGEQTATALENQLSVMEAKIEALLAQAEKEQKEVQTLKGDGSASSSQDTDGKSSLETNTSA